MSLINFYQWLQELNEYLDNKAPGVLKIFPLEEYEKLMNNRRKQSGYREPGMAVKELCRAIKNRFSANILNLYHRSLLVYMASVFVDSSKQFVTDDIRRQYCEEFERIVSELGTNAPDWYSWDEDLFCKDLAICSGRMFPAGCFKIEFNSGIPRGMFRKIKVAELIRFCRIMSETGGFRPLFEIHFDVRYRNRLTPVERENSLRMIAEMLMQYPNIKGLTASSWYYDPCISYISPHLTYLRQQLIDAGGEFFYSGSDRRIVELATYSSEVRRKLYVTGRYCPKSYTLIWPRRRIVEWIRSKNRVSYELPSVVSQR